MRIAARMGTIGTESAFEVSARARALEAEGRSIVYLQIGEPDFDTPANVRAAAKAALDAGATHYPPFPGIPALREAIAADASARKGFAVEPHQVFVTVGGKGVMVLDFTTWGWVHLVLGVIMGLTAGGLLSGQSWARWTAIFFAMVNAMVQVTAFSAFPLWALTVIALDVIVIYQLTANYQPARR